MLVFLSHSGSDTDAAKALKQRIADAPAAREAGLEVWLDVDELRPGDEWQPELERALERADAFLVYVGDRGVVNWVDRELRHALTRATGPGAIPFVPVLASDDLEPSILPPFVRQFQAVTDPLGDDRALSALISALVSGATPDVVLTDRPFVGLTAMGEAEADRFFGRDAEIAELSELVRRHRLVAVVADSGAGKSSLVRAGLVPAFRGGALLPAAGLTSPVPRHVVVMRPGADPVQGLKDGIDRAARQLGRDAGTRRALRQSVRVDDPGETYYALACDIDHDQPDILLVIDQFEELLTATPPDAADAFVKLILGLIDSDRRQIRVVLTVRVDYFNLTRRHTDLFARLEADEGAAQFRLKRVSDEGLDDIVKRPLIMAGHDEPGDRDALAAAIRRDITGRPGDLALVQMALYATWRRAQETGDDLMTAYTQAGGVLGALAHQAEETRQTLSAEEQSALLPLFARLVRLGDTGGATRRVAALSDLGERRSALARKLATEEAGRLLMVGDDTVEIAHEALVAQWPWLQEQIQAGADDIRTLARLGDRTAAWTANGAAALPNENERRSFAGLAQRHADWLSDDERACLAAARRRATLRKATGIAAILTILAFGVAAGGFAWRASVAERQAQQALVETMRAKRTADRAAQTADMEAQRATAALAEAASNAAGGLVALSEIAGSNGNWQDSLKLALAAWPRKESDRLVQLPDTIVSLSRALRALSIEHAAPEDITEFQAKFAPDGAYVAVRPAGSSQLDLIDTATGEVVARMDPYRTFASFAFSPDGRRFAAATTQASVVFIDFDRSAEPQRVPIPASYAFAVTFSVDGQKMFVGTSENEILEFATEPAPRLQRTIELTDGEWITALALSPDGRHLAVGQDRGLLDILDLDAGTKLSSTRLVGDFVSELDYAEGGETLAALVGRDAGTLLLVDAAKMQRFYMQRLVNENAVLLDKQKVFFPSDSGIGTLLGDQMASFSEGYPRSDGIWPIPTSLAVAPGGDRLVVAGNDGSLTVWDKGTGFLLAEFPTLKQKVLDMAFRPDGTLVLLDVSRQVRTVDLSTEPSVAWWTPETGPARKVWLSRDKGFLAVRRADGVVDVHRFPDGDKVGTIEDVADEADVYVANDGTHAAVSEGFEITIRSFAPDAGALIRLTPPGEPTLRTQAFSPDGRRFVITGGSRYQSFIHAYDTETGELVLDSDLDRGAFNIGSELRFADGRVSTHGVFGRSSGAWYALDGSNREFSDPDDAAEPDLIAEYLQPLATGAANHSGGAFSLDRTRLALLTDGDIDILDTATGAVIARLGDHFGNLIAVEYSDPGTLHAVTEDGRIGSWDLSDIATGNAFDIACATLDDADLYNALLGYPIVVSAPICGADYDPPLPKWMPAAYHAIGINPSATQ